MLSWTVPRERLNAVVSLSAKNLAMSSTNDSSVKLFKLTLTRRSTTMGLPIFLTMASQWFLRKSQCRLRADEFRARDAARACMSALGTASDGGEVL